MQSRDAIIMHNVAIFSQNYASIINLDYSQSRNQLQEEVHVGNTLQRPGLSQFQVEC